MIQDGYFFKLKNFGYLGVFQFNLWAQASIMLHYFGVRKSPNIASYVLHLISWPWSQVKQVSLNRRWLEFIDWQVSRACMMFHDQVSLHFWCYVKPFWPWISHKKVKNVRCIEALWFKGERRIAWMGEYFFRHTIKLMSNTINFYSNRLIRKLF